MKNFKQMVRTLLICLLVGNLSVQAADNSLIWVRFCFADCTVRPADAGLPGPVAISLRLLSQDQKTAEYEALAVTNSGQTIPLLDKLVVMQLDDQDVLLGFDLKLQKKFNVVPQEDEEAKEADEAPPAKVSYDHVGSYQEMLACADLTTISPALLRYIAGNAPPPYAGYTYAWLTWGLAATSLAAAAAWYAHMKQFPWYRAGLLSVGIGCWGLGHWGAAQRLEQKHQGSTPNETLVSGIAALTTDQESNKLFHQLMRQATEHVPRMSIILGQDGIQIAYDQQSKQYDLKEFCAYQQAQQLQASKEILNRSVASHLTAYLYAPGAHAQRKAYLATSKALVAAGSVGVLLAICAEPHVQQKIAPIVGRGIERAAAWYAQISS